MSDASGINAVQIYDGPTLLGVATVSSANWNYTTVALLDGSHTFTAQAIDNAGNITITPAVTATVDTTAPSVTRSNIIGTDTGSTTTIESGGLTKDNTLALSGTVSDANGVSSVKIYDGTMLLGPATVSSGNWSFTTATLPDGIHTFTAAATDNAGNTTTTSAVTATVNLNGGPLVTIAQLPSLTNNPVLMVSGTVVASPGEVAAIGGTVTLYDNGGATPIGTATVGTGGSWSTTITLSQGSNSLVAKNTDAAGNVGSSSATAITLNTTMLQAVAGYAFNETSGTTTVDFTGHGLTGTLTNGPVFATGEYGNAVKLNGVNQFVDLGNPTALQLTGSITVSAWINSSAFPTDDAVIVSKRSSGKVGFELNTTADTGPRTISFKLTNSSGASVYRYGATTLQANTWYFVTGVYDAAAQTLHVYLNGQLNDGVSNGTATSTQQNSTVNVDIGQRPGVSATSFNGLIDDVRIYNSALTQAQIQADMNTPGGGSVTVGPTAVATVTALSADTGTPGDFITTIASQTVSGTFTGTLGTGETIQVSADGGTTWVNATTSGSTWSAAGVTLLAASDTALSVRTIDTARNTTAGTGHSYTLDTVAPTAVATVTAMSADTGTPGDFITNCVADGQRNLYGALVTGETIQVSANGGTTWVNATASAGTWSAAGVTLLAASGTALSVRTIDTAGNTTAGTGHSYTLDTGRRRWRP